MALNRFVVDGNLTRDPELREAGGTPVCNFRIAHNETYPKESTLYFSVAVWGKRAESLAGMLAKGSRVVVDGRLSVREYEAKGENRTDLEIRADEIMFAGPRVEREASSSDDSGDGDEWGLPS